MVVRSPELVFCLNICGSLVLEPFHAKSLSLASVSVTRIDDKMSSHDISSSKGKVKSSSSDKGCRSTSVLKSRDKPCDEGAGDKAVDIVDTGESAGPSTEYKIMSSKMDALVGTVSNLVATIGPGLAGLNQLVKPRKNL